MHRQGQGADAGVAISMDCRGRCMDNTFIERLCRSMTYEAVDLNELTDGYRAERVIAEWTDFYSAERPHSSLDGQTVQPSGTSSDVTEETRYEQRDTRHIADKKHRRDQDQVERDQRPNNGLHRHLAEAARNVKTDADRRRDQ